jgi:signal transduction histidine kinase
MPAGGRQLRALLVEDSANDAELVLLELGRGGYSVTSERVQTGPDLERALERDWEIVLSDYSMPGYSGLEALSLVRRKGIDIPFIIVSGTVGEEAAVGAMRAGAHDYVLKQSLVRLCPAIDRELREAELRSSQKKMQEQLLISDRMASVGTLAAGVAHEINNPLAAIVANLELMARDLSSVAGRLDLTDRLHEVFSELSDARESADRLRLIVRDLKIFSRATDEEHRGAVEVERVLESSLRMAWNEIRHRAQLIREYSKVPPVEANEARLGQVFLNLIVNAAQAIREGDAEHNQIRVVTYMNNRGQVVTEVRDSGSGIPADNLTRIFDAFFTTKPVGIGTGLGLSICHRIVSGLGGRLEVESEVGKGSVFRVVLPRATSSAPAPKPPSLPPLVKSRRGRVLVVDDEPMIATAIGRTLAFDHEVVVSADATDALERILSGERFDVLLCDLMMPQMTGMDLHAALSESAPDQAERMIFLSGGAFTAAARAFLDEVPNERLDKPFDTRQLSALVNGRMR